jgi:hypothetical protein
MRRARLVSGSAPLATLIARSLSAANCKIPSEMKVGLSEQSRLTMSALVWTGGASRCERLAMASFCHGSVLVSARSSASGG